MVARIYDRPDLDQRRGLPALYVSGALPDGKPALAYEGRLQIHNAVGACTAEQIDGDTLPPGYALYVDQETMEVVVTWPAYVEHAAPIQNPGFEDGMAGWAAGAGWSVTTDNAITGSRSAVYQRTGGSSVISSQSRYPVNPGVPISAECWVRQGASSAGNAGAGLRLEFRDGAGDVIDRADGNYVMSASKNAVYPSNVTALPPAGAATVNVAGVGVRHRENKDVWIDSFSWNHYVAAAGINIETTFSLILRVRDSSGRTAIWSGAIQVTGFDPIDFGAVIWVDDASSIIMGSPPNGAMVEYWESRGAPEFLSRSSNVSQSATISATSLNGNRVLSFGPAGTARFYSGTYVSGDVNWVPFAKGCNYVWAFAVFKRNTPNGAGAFVTERCPWSVVAGGNYGTYRFSMQIGTTGNLSVESLRNDESSAISTVAAVGVVPVGQWVMAMVCCDYISRTASIYVNGELVQSGSGLWDASGPTSNTDSPYVAIGGSILNPSGGPSGGAANRTLVDVDVACVMAGNSASPLAPSDIAGLFGFYADHYNLPLA